MRSGQSPCLRLLGEPLLSAAGSQAAAPIPQPLRWLLKLGSSCCTTTHRSSSPPSPRRAGHSHTPHRRGPPRFPFPSPVATQTSQSHRLVRPRNGCCLWQAKRRTSRDWRRGKDGRREKGGVTASQPIGRLLSVIQALPQRRGGRTGPEAAQSDAHPGAFLR